MGRKESLEAEFEKALSDSGVELVDVESGPGVVRVLIDREGGIDVESLSDVNRLLSHLLDSREDLAPSGPYGLEVSSPGIERPLKTPAHFSRFVGSTVALRTRPGGGGERRLTGRLMEADDAGILIETDAENRRLSYHEIERARTVFQWGAPDGVAKRAKAHASHKGEGKG